MSFPSIHYKALLWLLVFSFPAGLLLLDQTAACVSRRETSLPTPEWHEDHSQAKANPDESKTLRYDGDQRVINDQPSVAEKPSDGRRDVLKFVENHEGAFVGIGTLALVLVTFLLAIATGFLWKETRDLVNGAELTAERQLRAYLSYSTVEIRNFGVDSPLEAILTVKNCGQTPAYDVRDFVAIRIAKYPNSELPVPSFAVSNACMGPGNEGITTARMEDPLTFEQTRSILAGQSAVYVIGEIRYWDAFRKVERFSRYQGYYRGPGDPDAVPTNLVVLRHTTDGNGCS